MAEEIRYQWQQQLLDAFLSPVRDLSQKIAIAEGAIAARLQESRQTDPAEQMALRDALRALKVLIAETKADSRQNSRIDRKQSA
jgi:hypothetical protein